MSMFGVTITSIRDAVAQLKGVKDGQEFTALLSGLRNFLKSLDVDPQCFSGKSFGADAP